MKLFLFSTDERVIGEALSAGVDGVVIDWENAGKYERQASADTQINSDTIDDLIRLRRTAESATIIVRINGFGVSTANEIQAAIDGGADEILMPMVTSAAQVESALDLVGKRIPFGILVETESAVGCADVLATLPLSRVYVGLNDLAISRGYRNIFRAVADGTVEAVRARFSASFGFGGLTHPRSGSPLRCELLLNEMVRLKSDFTFLRRSFHADAAREGIVSVVAAIREELAAAANRSETQREALHRELVESICATA